MGIIWTLITGAIAGWLGSRIYTGSGLGVIGNIVVGIVGAVVGNWLLTQLNINFGDGIIGFILTGALGAIVILFIINLFIPKRK